MSYASSAALQGAVYQKLRADAQLSAIIGDAVFDAMPVAAPSGVHVVLGPETMRDAGDVSAAGSVHDFVISVLAGGDQGTGFAPVKAAAAAVEAALESGVLELTAGRLVGLYLLRAQARRTNKNTARQVDLTFRARIDLG